MGFATAFPPILVSLLTLYIYSVFAVFQLYPQLSALEFSHDPDIRQVDPFVHRVSKEEIIIVCTLFHLAFFMMILCFLRALLTPAGGIPNDRKWVTGKFKISKQDELKLKRIINDPSIDVSQPDVKAFLQRIPVVERKKLMGDYRKCRRCGKFKPDRSHHCAICETCVLRMDHHCPWIANCVGFHNYKYFCLLLFYAILSTGTVVFYMYHRFSEVFRPVVDVEYFVARDLQVAIAYFLSLFLFSALIIFYAFHLYLTFNAMSTIEFREKKSSDDKAITRKFEVAHVKYDRGFWKNICHVYGPPHLWLIPVAPHLSADGTYFSFNSEHGACRDVWVEPTTESDSGWARDCIHEHEVWEEGQATRYEDTTTSDPGMVSPAGHVEKV